MKKVTIDLILPKAVRLEIPEELYDEFEQTVGKNSISDFFTAALKNELKILRFRHALQRTRHDSLS